MQYISLKPSFNIDFDSCQVFVNLHAAHMDPSIWKDPDVFRPKRFLDEHNNIIGRDRVIPFSLGLSQFHLDSWEYRRRDTGILPFNLHLNISFLFNMWL